MFVLRAVLAAILALAAPIAAQAQAQARARAQAGGAASWDYYSSISPDPFQATLALVYGVPETDAVQFVAQCFIGNRGPYVQVEIGAAIGVLPDDAGIEVTFFAPSGYTQTVAGAVVGRAREEGITGASIAVSTDDAFWQGIINERSLRYMIAGEAEATLDLRGSSAPTANFLRDCANIGDLVATEMPPEDDPTASCNAFGTLRSQGGGQAQTVIFHNQTEGWRALLWLDYEGNPVDYGGMNPGESIQIESATLHPWMLTAGPGNCHEIIMPVAGQVDYYVTVPNQYFGAE